MNYELICIVLGVYNLWLHFRIRYLKQTMMDQIELILQMAEELNELGSPNVKVIKRDSDLDT